MTAFKQFLVRFRRHRGWLYSDARDFQQFRAALGRVVEKR